MMTNTARGLGEPVSKTADIDAGDKLNERTPRVSIGLAVYNGERYLDEAIRSILNQTFTDFELIICDNASTDATADICQKYARQDSRIRYTRNPKNIGGANNENLTFRMARGRYFRWAAHDDVLEPRLLEECCRVLDDRPDVVLCHPQTVIIDDTGERQRVISRNKAKSARPSERFSELTPFDHDCEETYGLIRADALKKTGLQRNYTDSDRTLLAHLSLLGKFHEVPEPLFCKRVHSEMSTQVYSGYRERMAWFGEEYKKSNNYPYCAQLFHYLSIISAAPIGLWEKMCCYRHMASWVFSERRWRSITKDVLLAGFNLVSRVGARAGLWLSIIALD